MTTDPYSIAEAWLFGILHTDPQLAVLVASVEPEVVPTDAPWETDGAVLRYVVFVAPPATADSFALGAEWVESELVYIVKGIARVTGTPDVQALTPIAERIDALLQQAEAGPVAGGGYLQSCVRASGIKHLETDKNGIRYLHLGARYALVVAPEGA